MKYFWCLIRVVALVLLAHSHVAAESVTIWKFGDFDGSNSELADGDSMPSTVNLIVGADGAGNGLPGMHSPPDDDFNPDNCNVINITFSAQAGNYTLRIGQLFTYQAETVTVSLDGGAIGTYTTSTSGDAVHELALNIANSGSHTLTFEEFFGNNGYGFDALELVTDIDGLTALPATIYLLAVHDIGTFSLYGGIGDYRVTSDNDWIADVELSNDGKRVYVKATGPGQTTITVQDQASSYIKVTVVVDDNPNKNATYDATTNEMIIPSVEILGEHTRTSYTVKGSLSSYAALYLALSSMQREELESTFCLLITGAKQNSP